MPAPPNRLAGPQRPSAPAFAGLPICRHLTYLLLEEGHIAIEQCLVELDRATLSVDRLGAELARYAQLHRVRDKGGEALWRYRYLVFPRVICILAGAPREALIRRRDVALVLLDSDPRLSNTYEVEISFCLLEDLRRRGPFTPIFRAVGEPERKVNWRGQCEPESEGDERWQEAPSPDPGGDRP